MAASPALLLLISSSLQKASPFPSSSPVPTVVSPPLPPPLEMYGAAPTSIPAANAAARTTSIAQSTWPPFSNSDQPPRRPSPLPALHGLPPLPRARLPALPLLPPSLPSMSASATSSAPSSYPSPSPSSTRCAASVAQPMIP